MSQKIMIVEDDPHVREGLKALLELNGYEIVAVESADKAVEKIDDSIELVITDNRMPGISGLDLIPMVKKRYPAVPVILFTGVESKTTWTMALERGANDYIEKPFHESELLFSVKRALNMRVLKIQMKESQEKLVQALKMAAVGKLHASIAHEFTNPLTGIKGYAQLIEKKCPKEARFIIEQVNHLRDIVDNVRTFSKLTPLSLEKGSILDPLEKALTLIKAQLAAYGILVEKKISKNLSPVFIDSSRLQQVFINLILNAKNAIEERGDRNGKIRIEIKEEKGSDGDQLLIQVKDNGMGMKPEIKEKLFEAFFTTKKTGLGLGLSIVKDIVDEHHGKIECETEFGKETTFIIDLPLEQRKEAPDGDGTA